MGSVIIGLKLVFLHMFTTRLLHLIWNDKRGKNSKTTPFL